LDEAVVIRRRLRKDLQKRRPFVMIAGKELIRYAELCDDVAESAIGRWHSIFDQISREHAQRSIGMVLVDIFDRGTQSVMRAAAKNLPAFRQEVAVTDLNDL